MISKIQLARGNSFELEKYTPAKGEAIFVIDNNEIRVGDGETVGGNLAVSGVVFLGKDDELPKSPGPLSRWIIRKLGGRCDVNVAHCLETNRTYVRCQETLCWRVVDTDKILVAENLGTMVLNYRL